MCLWPPAKISASCVETDVPSSCSERGWDEHWAEGNTSPPLIQVVSSLCDITKGLVDSLSSWARWQSGEAAFSPLWPGHVQIYHIRFWRPCVRNVKRLLSESLLSLICSFCPQCAQCALLFSLRIPRPVHNSPSVEAPLMRRMWSWEHLHHVTVTRLPRKVNVVPGAFSLRSPITRHHSGVSRGGSVLAYWTEIRV